MLVAIEQGVKVADRMLELTGTIPKRQMAEQVLGQMELERERGINLIDTPDHTAGRAAAAVPITAPNTTGT